MRGSAPAGLFAARENVLTFETSPRALIRQNPVNPVVSGDRRIAPRLARLLQSKMSEDPSRCETTF